jgi:hypothetical protein
LCPSFETLASQAPQDEVGHSSQALSRAMTTESVARSL